MRAGVISRVLGFITQTLPSYLLIHCPVFLSKCHDLMPKEHSKLVRPVELRFIRAGTRSMFLVNVQTLPSALLIQLPWESW